MKIAYDLISFDYEISTRDIDTEYSKAFSIISVSIWYHKGKRYQQPPKNQYLDFYSKNHSETFDKALFSIPYTYCSLFENPKFNINNTPHTFFIIKYGSER